MLNDLSGEAMAKQWGSDGEAIGVTGRDGGYGGYGFAQRHREGTENTEERFETLAVLSNYLQDSDSLSADGTEGQEGNCFPVPCTEGIRRTL